MVNYLTFKAHFFEPNPQNFIGHSGVIDEIKHIPNSSLYISFDLTMTYFVSDIRTGEVYSRYLYVASDTPGVKGVAALSNGDIYISYSTSSL